VSVLVAEDDLVNQMVIEEMLKLLGCEVDVVGDGEAAWRAVAEGPTTWCSWIVTCR
jgi:CheY-like chemotaxis protein